MQKMAQEYMEAGAFALWGLLVLQFLQTILECVEGM